MDLAPINVLISLHKGYGLGDAVQMSAVLQHVAKYRPHWKVDYQAERGREVVGRGLVSNVFVYGDPYPSQHYDAEVEILLFDTWSNWQDRPNTRVSSCLHERFGLPWDSECGRYVINVRNRAMDQANALVHRNSPPDTKYVAIHYQGDSSQNKKNLSEAEADTICSTIMDLGMQPVILDWRHRSSLRHRKLWSPSHWGPDAEMNCAVIWQCVAFIGIDSGPSKCASSTDVPSLVIWTGHHPAPFHDPAPNTTHLVPVGYHGLEPVCNDAGVIEWFEKHHNVITYDNNLTRVVKHWLKEVL